MKTKFNIDDLLIISKIEENYSLQVHKITFLPKGDIAYAYIITCVNGVKYFLKLFDKNTKKGRENIRYLDFYLPLTWEIYNKGLYKNITYPIRDIKGNLYVDLGTAVIVMFNFIEGDTLADAYPFSKPLLEKVAKGIAEIHRVKDYLKIENAGAENFEIPFEIDLVKMLNKLENTEKFESQDIQSLKEYLVPRKNKVLDFLEQLHEYREKALNNPGEMVLTHGDIWGGNLMLDQSDSLYFIDWESAMMAPREADLRHYLFEDFNYFMDKYQEQLGSTTKLDNNLLAFYVYKSHLSNLTNWVFRMLYNNQDSEQNKSDFECITFHCMERWEGAESRIRQINEGGDLSKNL